MSDGDFLVDFLGKSVAREERIEPGAQDRDRAFQLVGGIGGKARRALQFFRGGLQFGFGPLPLGEIFLRDDGQLFHRARRRREKNWLTTKPPRRSDAAGPENLPAQLPLP